MVHTVCNVYGAPEVIMGLLMNIVTRTRFTAAGLWRANTVDLQGFLL